MSASADGKTVLVVGEKLLSFSRASSGKLRLIGSARFRGLLMAADSTADTVYGGYGAEYAGGSGFGVVDGFMRDASGALSAIAAPGGCSTQRVGDLSRSGEIVGAPTSPPCADGRAIIDPRALALSPDGANLYVAGGGYEALPGGVAVFSRAP
jgi:hypothetical protein